MGKVISVINMKGGVGKTTLSTGIADYISNHHEKHYKTLLIDVDPQFNATQALLDLYKEDKKKFDEEENFYNCEVKKNKKTIYTLFRSRTDLSQKISTPKSEDLIISLSDNLDILCGDLNLVLVNKYNDSSNLKRIANFIEDNGLLDKYDYIIIDCPPTLTIYTDSALMASDFYIIPNRIDRFSIIGINSLQSAVDMLIYSERIKLKCLGIVYTMVNKNNSPKQERLKNNFESKDIINNIDIFASSTSRYENLQVGISGSIPTCYSGPMEEIEAISLEFLSKINNYESKDI